MANDPLVIIVLVLLFMVAFLLFADRRKLHSEGRYAPQSAPQIVPFPVIDEERLTGFPYRANENFLSPAEVNFFHNLRGAVANRAIIAPKAGLGDLFWVQLGDKTQFRAYRNKIDRKHVDFLLCDPATLRPIMGIALDDSSHQHEERQARDTFVDGVFAAAGLPLVHMPLQRAYTASEIAAQLAPHLTAPQFAGARPAIIPMQPITGSGPCCPTCGEAMVLRTAKIGFHAGTKFWACANYPKCRSMVPYLN